MREDFHASGKCPALAGLLPGVQGEIPAGRVPHQKVSEMRKDLHLSIKRSELAKILPGMLGKRTVLKFRKFFMRVSGILKLCLFILQV